MIFGSNIDIFVILLSKSITYELIESDTLIVPHGLLQFGTKPSLKASNSL